MKETLEEFLEFLCDRCLKIVDRDGKPVNTDELTKKFIKKKEKRDG